MSHEIRYPTETTYIIAYTDTTTFGYLVVHPTQVMRTGQPYLWTSLSEADWLKELLNVFNTIPEPPY